MRATGPDKVNVYDRKVHSDDDDDAEDDSSDCIGWSN